MMSRRHWIAHRADRNTQTEGVGHQIVRSISVALVKRWIKGVEEFGKEVLKQDMIEGTTSTREINHGHER